MNCFVALSLHADCSLAGVAFLFFHSPYLVVSAMLGMIKLYGDVINLRSLLFSYVRRLVIKKWALQYAIVKTQEAAMATYHCKSYSSSSSM